MKNLSRSPFVWLSATALSAMLYFFAFHFFPQTFPLIHLNITMDLEQALEQANTITEKNNFGPADHHSAAMFHTDAAVKTFVELEAGGKDALISMMEKKLYLPYTWKVRHFKEHEKNETTITFTPDGLPYGFIETLSENIPGTQLSETAARAIAEDDATQNWNIDFNDYTLVETSQKTEMSQRIDHTFVYERTDTKIGEGLYRLKIVVSGDKTTELTHFVKVPESFTRRYTEMRSANNTLGLIASLLILLLYIIGGCGFGLYWIIKQRWHIFKQPLMWAIFLTIIMTLASINQLPFLWMSYNSAFSINGFLMQLCLIFFISLLAQIPGYTIIIATAESLTRRAFGNQPQLWSLWSASNASSYAVLGRTFGGYLLVGFHCAFVIAFYLLSLRYLGWWSPSDTLFDPNILATYVPWLSPLATALHAGFIEECLFRAIPLAGAALLGNYFGKRNWWITIAFIMQAIIFGLAHATYPVQPSYARIVELFIPSCIFGITYLRYGLLTSIIAHSVYDVIWMSLPLFVSHAPEAYTYKLIIIIITLLPLLYVIYRCFTKGRITQLPASAKNAAWQPSTPITKEKSTATQTESHPQNSAATTYHKSILMAGILGLATWICTTRFTHDGITITINRNEAINSVQNFLQNKNITLHEPWKAFPLIFTHYKLVPQIANQHIFIWKKGKKELYHQLLGTYLNPAHWTIRYAQFDTDIIARTEEYKIMLYNNAILRSYHQLPESAAGKSLTQVEARNVAHTALREQFNLDPSQLTEISATQTQLPNRTNWLFIFANTAIYPLTTGQARISIAIAGDEIVDAAGSIHVPEEWERKEHNKQNTLNIILIIFSLMLIFSLLFGLIIALRHKATFVFNKSLFFVLWAALICISIIDVINTWPSIIGAFNTSLPLRDQLFQFITMLGLSALLKSAFSALILSYILSFKTSRTMAHSGMTLITGIASGFCIAGMLGCANTIIPINIPLWPSYDILGCVTPLLASVLYSITHYIQLTTLFSLLFIIVDTATAQWQKNRIIFTLIGALYGMGMIALPSLKILPLWIIIGGGIGYILIVLYKYIVRYNYALIPLATGSFMILQYIQQGIFNAYPGAISTTVGNICTIAIASFIWHNYSLRKQR